MQNYLNKKDCVHGLEIPQVIKVSLLVEIRHCHQAEQKGSSHDGYGGSRRRQRKEVDEEVPGVPGPDAVVHPNTVMVETVHTSVTHPCKEGNGSDGLALGEPIKTRHWSFH